MAVVVFLNPSISINGTALSDHVTAFTLTVEAADVETTAFGTGWRSRKGGLKDGSVQIDFNQDFAASSVNATIAPLLGSYATVVASDTTSGTCAGTAVCLVTSVTPLGGAVGDLLTQSVTWPTSGTVTGFGL